MKSILLLLLTITTPCLANASGLVLSPGWKPQVIAECAEDMPDMLLLSQNKQYLYQSCETKAGKHNSSLARIHIATGKRDVLLRGLNRADGMRFAPDGSIWLGEEQSRGKVWRIQEPDKLPAQHINGAVRTDNKQVQPILSAGIFAHEGLAFSQDGKYLYLADEWGKGCLYRLTLATQQLHVFHEQKGWLHIITRLRLVRKLKGCTAKPLIVWKIWNGCPMAGF